MSEKDKSKVKYDDQQPKVYNTTLEFGKVETGQTFRKIFKVRNDTKVSQQYYIKRDPDINPIYQVFDFQVITNYVDPKNFFKVKILFRPNVPNFKYIDNFYVLDESNNCYKILLSGISLGPQVITSIKSLYFFITGKECIKKHIFELKNVSNIEANYQFNIDNSGVPFTVENYKGILESKEHTYVTVRFKPKEIRDYSCMLTCLIKNQKPILIQMYGVYDPKYNYNLSEVQFLTYGDIIAKEGYLAYIGDCIKIRDDVPPISLSNTYLDFGFVLLSESKTLTTCLTNHMNVPIKVIWDNLDSVFLIRPKEIDLPIGESILFECTFTPNTKDEMYSKILRAQIYWGSLRNSYDEELMKRYISIPLHVSLHVLGDSFPEFERWIPLVELQPEVVILPATIPNYSTYGSFIIKAKNGLPTSFSFIPPRKTNFTLKPMVGIVNDSQIIIVHLKTNFDDNMAYMEYWEVMLNGRKDNCIPFYIKCFSSLPSIVVEDKNVVVFNPVHVNCRETAKVSVKNNSVHQVKYEFSVKLKDISYLEIEGSTGEIASNDSLIMTWHIFGNEILKSSINVTCKLFAMQDMTTVIGEFMEIPITVQCECVFTELCATPHKFELNLIEFATVHKLTFNVFNFSEATVYFKLFAYEDGEPLQKNNLIIDPILGSLRTKEHFPVNLTLWATNKGEHTILIKYAYCMPEHCQETALVIENHKLVKLTFTVIYPTIEILDITCHNFGPNFSKTKLWKSLNLDSINKALSSLQIKQTMIVESYLPDYEENALKFFAVMLLQNKTNFDTSMEFKRMKMCECKPVTGSKGISRRKVYYTCPHRDMFEVSVSNDIFRGFSYNTIKINVQYLLSGSVVLAYKMLFSCDRSIEWYFHLKTNPISCTIPSSYKTFHLQFNAISLKRRDQPVQGFYFYNDNKNVVTYSLDTSNIDELNSINNIKIIECLNPDDKVEPLENMPLLLKFSPIQVDGLKLNLPLKIGNESVNLVVEGAGLQDETFVKYTPSKIPLLPYLSNSTAPVALSVNEIIVPTMATWSHSYRLIFIKNTSKTQTYGYSWNMRIIPGILKIRATRRKGVLAPNESQGVIIKITSFDIPCDLTLTLVCKLLNHTQHYNYLKSIHEYATKEKEIEGQFTITELGTTYPKNDVVILPEAPVTYLPIDINVNVIGIADRDICMPAINQFGQSPQLLLTLNKARFLESFQKDNNNMITTFLIDKIKAEEEKTTSLFIDFLHKDYKNMKRYNIEMYKFVCECLITDVLHSNLFTEVITRKDELPSGYYVQYKYNTNDYMNVFKSTSLPVEANNLNSHCRNMFLRDFMERPQMQAIAEVFNTLIIESIHQTFYLGPTKEDIEDIKKMRPIRSIKYLCGCKEDEFEV